MTDAVKEQLSACLDGELPKAELDLLLKRVGRDAQLGDSLGRYALVGEALRSGQPAAASKSFAANVMAAIEQEPVAARPAMRISSSVLRRLRPVAGMAVAAGVAAVAVLSVQRVGILEQVANQPQQASPSAQVVAQVPSEDSSSYVVPASTSGSPLVAATRLTNFVVAHSDYSSPLARRSVLTSVLAEDDVDSGLSEDDASAENDPAAIGAQPQER